MNTSDMKNETIIKKPETLGEIKDFLTMAIKKALALTPASFGKFTSDRLPDDYLYDKWIGKNKDFGDVYLNMDDTNRELYIKYVVGQSYEDIFYLSFILRHFFMFCYNYDSRDFKQNPFTGKYGQALLIQATGKKNPSGVTCLQVQKLFNKLDDNGKLYLVECAFGETASA